MVVEKIEKPDNIELKRIFDSQCSPCISGYPECCGDTKLATEWKCPKFYSGFMVLNIKK